MNRSTDLTPSFSFWDGVVDYCLEILSNVPVKGVLESTQVQSTHLDILEHGQTARETNYAPLPQPNTVFTFANLLLFLWLICHRIDTG